jgi:hypothetical protein
VVTLLKRKLPASHLVPALLFSALKARRGKKTGPSPKRCPEDLKARPLLRLRPEGLRRLRRVVHSDGPTHQRHAAIKVVPDPAEESGTRSPGRLPAPSRPGPGLRLKGPRLAPALSASAWPGGKMTAPQLRDGPKERRGKPPLHLPASARTGRAVRGKRSTTPSPPGESLPRPTSRGGAEDPPLAPVPFAQSDPFVRSLIAPPRPSRARPRSECGSCPCPRRCIWGWDPKEAQHLGGGGLPDTLSAGRRNPIFAKGDFRERRSLRPSSPSSEENAAPLAKTLSGSSPGTSWRTGRRW